MDRGYLPESLHESRTVFIPKRTEEGRELQPADFGPLSIPSVVVRHFHKILGSRLGTTEGLLSDEQRAFRKGADGIAENLCVLNALLRESRSSLKTVHLATLDVSKAFDTVSHSKLFEACQKAGIPEDMIMYLRSVYAEAYTTLSSPNGRSINNQRIKPTRGVRQGDPLSPTLFSLVIDRVLGTLNKDVGILTNGVHISALAFADDLVICASTQVGLQRNLDAVGRGLGRFGLRLNPSKCKVLSQVVSGRDKKVKVMETPLFSYEGVRLHQCAALDLWNYLGVQFVGTRVGGAKVSLADELDRVSRAPLKPQQRLHILRTYLIPRHNHTWVLGRMGVGAMRALDVTVRQAVRKWLHLPADTALGFFHAPIRAGGLGIPRLSEFIPHLRLRRLLALKESSAPHVVACAGGTLVGDQVDWCRARLAHITEPTRTGSLYRHWEQLWHASVDGITMCEAGGSRYSTDWQRGSARMPGADFVHYSWIRANTLACGMRCSRGRRTGGAVVMCRAGCRETETAGHIIQKCHRTHGGRILRHNALVKAVGNSLLRKGWTLTYEKTYRTPAGPRKPDMVAWKDDRIAVIDAQVVSARRLDQAHLDKVRKYRDDAEIAPIIIRDLGGGRHGARRRGEPNISFETITLSWRGVLSRVSALGLESLGVDRRTLRRLPTMAMKGSYLNWVRWNAMT